MAEIDLTTDRSLASATGNYQLYLPKNNGPEDSWGELLNENFELIDARFADIDEQINQTITTERELSASIGNLDIRVKDNKTRIDTHAGALSSLDARITNGEVELADAQGSLASVGDRLRLLNDDDGAPRTDLYLSGVKRLQWIKFDSSVISNTSFIDITDIFLTEQSSSGINKGIIAEGSSHNYGFVFTDDKQPVYNANGERIIVRTLKTGNTLRFTFESLSGVTFIFNQTNAHKVFTDIVIFYPKMTSAHDLVDSNERPQYIESTLPATNKVYGTVRTGSGGGADVDMVDGYHASGDPTPNALLPLNGSAQYSPTIIFLSDVNENNSTLALENPKFLRAREGEALKSIDNYIGIAGAELFTKTASGDNGSAFTKTVSEIESQLDYAIGGVDSIATQVAGIQTGYVNADNILRDSITQTQQDLNTEILRSETQDGITSGEVSNIDLSLRNHMSGESAHHSATSFGLDIEPASVITQSITAVNAFIENLNVLSKTSIQQEFVVTDKFLDIAMPSGEYLASGEAPGDYGSMQLPLAQDPNYGGGFLFHKGTTGPSGEYAVLRHNPITGFVEFCEDWSAFKVAPSGEPFYDNNKFIQFGHQESTAVVHAANPFIMNAINALPVGGGRIVLREGTYDENITIPSNVVIEGQGYSTYINGTVTIAGSRAMLSKCRVKTVNLQSGGHNHIIWNHIDNDDFTDNSGDATNMIWGNL